MAGVSKFEDLDAWKKSRELAVRIYKLTNKGEFSRDFGFRDQIRRAAVSVMSNIAKDLSVVADLISIVFW